jgi:galactose mutarotase-like enzyme
MTGRDLTLKAGPWDLTLRPERGGRIVSLRLGGVELLDQGIGVDDPGATGFVEGGAWGWDEMVPNLEATDRLLDHGEAWRLPWTLLDASPTSARTQVGGRLVPWELERRLELADGVVRAEYMLTNPGPNPLVAYWCAHPLFRFEPGMSISVPDLARIGDLAGGSSKKVHLLRGSVDRIVLRWRSGAGVEMRWDVAKTPYVAIWACNGDLGGYRQIAIEPATGGGDGLDPGAPAPMLEAGSTLSWWLEIREA